MKVFQLIGILVLGSHNMWGNYILGGGLSSSGAFLFLLYILKTVQYRNQNVVNEKVADNAEVILIKFRPIESVNCDILF